jgi:hypothetical protein
MDSKLQRRILEAALDLLTRKDDPPIRRPFS